MDSPPEGMISEDIRRISENEPLVSQKRTGACPL